MGREFDLDFARVGYLRAPDGRHIRYVVGLERIARDLTRLGIQVFWESALDSLAGCAFCDARVILLAPWLSVSDPLVLKDVLTEELAHCVVGPDDEVARIFQRRWYGDLVFPVSA